MTTAPTILFADSDRQSAMLLKYKLEKLGYSIQHFWDGYSAWQSFKKSRYQFCLIDRFLPRKDGLSLLRSIRNINDRVPVIIISSKNEINDRMMCFQALADGYVDKPVRAVELGYRIERLLKLTAGDTFIAASYRIGDLEFNYFEKALTYLPNPTRLWHLSEKGAELLLFFIKHADKILLREEILYHVWNKSDHFMSRSMDVTMVQLRQALKEDPRVQLMTIHGIGFKLILP